MNALTDNPIPLIVLAAGLGAVAVRVVDWLRGRRKSQQPIETKAVDPPAWMKPLATPAPTAAAVGPAPQPRPRRQWTTAKVSGASLGAVALLATIPAALWSNATTKQFSFAMNLNNVDDDAQPKITTQDLARQALPQYMQPQPVAPPSTEDILRQAATNLTTDQRIRMRGVLGQAAALIRETRIRKIKGRDNDALNYWIQTHMQTALGPQFEEVKPYLRTMGGLAEEFNTSGQFQNMTQVADFVQGAGEVLK